VLPYALLVIQHKAENSQLVMTDLKTTDDWENYVIQFYGAWALRNMAPLRTCFSKAVQSERDVMLDKCGVTQVDSTYVGIVMLFA
jgi:CMP-N-acetylneuraminic acid synthetase